MQSFEQMQAMGIAAMIPGFQMAIDTLQSAIDEMRRQLSNLQNPPAAAPRKQGRTPLTDEERKARIMKRRVSKAARGYWAKMTPEERSVEMKRRLALGRKFKYQSKSAEAPQPDFDKTLQETKKRGVKEFEKALLERGA
jgi:hypothetical protein